MQFATDKTAVNITAEITESCKLRLDCEVRDSLRMQLSSTSHTILGGQTVICSANGRSNDTIDGNNMTMLYNPDSSILKCSIILNAKEILSLIGEDLPIINCLNVDIGISRNVSINISLMILNSQGIYTQCCLE